VKGTRVKKADKFRSKQFSSRTATSYSTDQLRVHISTEQAMLVSVPMSVGLQALLLPAFRRGARRVMLCAGVRQKVRGGTDSKTKFFVRKEAINRWAESWST